MPTLNARKLAATLSKTPEKRFCITDLAPKLINEEGRVDIVKAIQHQGDVNLAIAEIQRYVREVDELAGRVSYLKSCGTAAISGEEDEEDFE